MSFSRHKLYNLIGVENKHISRYGRRLSIRQSFQYNSRYLKEIGKESIFEKPYLDKSRPQMHQNWSIPDWNWPTPYDGIGRPVFRRYIWDLGLCWSMAWTPIGCKEGKSSGSAWIGIPAPRDSKGKWVWQVTSDLEEVSVQNIEAKPKDIGYSLSFDLIAQDGFEGSVQICVVAQYSGSLLHIADAKIDDFAMELNAMVGGNRRSPGFPFATPEMGIFGTPHQAPTASMIPIDYYHRPIIDCGCTEVTVETCCACADDVITMTYTTQSMQVDEEQNLGIANYGNRKANCFSWEISSGGGSLSDAKGFTTTYTAPATNSECGDNPTIALLCDGAEIDTLEIAINGYVPGGRAYTYSSPCYPNKRGCAQCTDPGHDGPSYHCWWGREYDCNGGVRSGNEWYTTPWAGADIQSHVCGGGSGGCGLGVGSCECIGNSRDNYGIYPEAFDAYRDWRTGAMKTGSCCPIPEDWY